MLPTNPINGLFNTNNVVQFVLPAKEAAWHGLTWMHVAGMAIGGWIFHTNWDKISAAWNRFAGWFLGVYAWLGSEGGTNGVWNTIKNGKPKQ